MSAAPPAPAPAPKKRRHHSHRRDGHHRHHHRRHHESNCLFFGIMIFFLLLLVGWVIASYWYPWNQPVKLADNDPNRFNQTVFVFKKRHNFAERRITRGACKVGERWDEDLKLCGPIFNTPTAFDGTIMNASIPACTSFFGSMCGKWNADHVNEDRTFSYGYHRNQRVLERIITNSPPASPISQFYRSCMGITNVTNARESIHEVVHLLESIVGDLNSYGDLPMVFGRLARHGYTAPFVFSIERHPTEPRMIPFISWDGFAKVDERLIYNVFESARTITMFPAAVMLNKVERVHKLIKAMNHKNTQPLDDIVDYMSYVRSYFKDDVIHYDELPAWNMRPVNTSKGWNLYFQSLDGMGLRFAPKQTVWVIGFPYLNWLLQEALYQFDLSDWRAYVQFSILFNGRQFNPALPNNVYFRKWDTVGPVGRDSRIYHRVPRGALDAPSGVAQCIAITQHMIPGLVGESYLKSMQQKEVIRAEIKNMTRRILNVYADLVRDTPWLTPETKDIAVDKIQNVIVRVAEPDEWEVEPFAASLSADRYDHNMNLIRRYRVHRNLQLWHRDIPNALDRNALAFFSGPLSDVNAYYSGPTNTITILAGILQPPFYSIEYNNVSKHAILGSVIGHELGHLLDYHGLYWDKNGSLQLDSIWPRDVMEAFRRKSRCVEAEFGMTATECPGQEDGFSYGNITFNEDLSDLTGVRMSYKSYFEKTPEGMSATLGDRQHFFMIFAQTWCSSYTQAVKCANLEDDPHAFPEYRVDRTLRNIREFHEAFACSGSNPMFKASDKQCIVYGR